MEQNFNLVINDTVYPVLTPPQEKPSRVSPPEMESCVTSLPKFPHSFNPPSFTIRRSFSNTHITLISPHPLIASYLKMCCRRIKEVM